MLAHTSGRGSVAQWCLLLSLLPVLVRAQASKTSQISSATKALSTLGAATASPFCTSYIGSKPVSVRRCTAAATLLKMLILTCARLCCSMSPFVRLVSTRPGLSLRRSLRVRCAQSQPFSDVLPVCQLHIHPPDWRASSFCVSPPGSALPAHESRVKLIEEPAAIAPYPVQQQQLLREASNPPPGTRAAAELHLRLVERPGPERPSTPRQRTCTPHRR